MVFSSNVFLFVFLPITLILYYIIPANNRNYRNCLLFIVSLFFYGWGEPVYVLLMLAVIVVDYFAGILMSRNTHKKGVLFATLLFNLAVLMYFKYASFFIKTLNTFLPTNARLQVAKVALPIGISFYIFQSMSYLIDLWRGEVTVQHNLISFGTYVAFFPQLIAGPIVRYRDIELQLYNRRESLSQFSSGLTIFIIGLAKKMLLANKMGELWSLLQNSGGSLSAWVGMFAFTLQIYFDFSGYSDMAIGLGRLFGFEFCVNFKFPYVAQSITEFWRRWHISLSTWFREYVYIPLGGNQKGKNRQIINIFVVWALTGLWHGASWNFVLWGLYYAIWLCIEKFWLQRILENIPKFLRHICVILVVSVGWMLFYFEDLHVLIEFLRRLLIFQKEDIYSANVIISFLPITLIASFCSVTDFGTLIHALHSEKLKNYLGILILIILFLLCTAALASQSYNPFIYFRF